MYNRYIYIYIIDQVHSEATYKTKKKRSKYEKGNLPEYQKKIFPFSGFIAFILEMLAVETSVLSSICVSLIRDKIAALTSMHFGWLSAPLNPRSL